jgi:hypothetical protein
MQFTVMGKGRWGYGVAPTAIEEPHRMKIVLSCTLNRFSLVAHLLGGQRYHHAVAPNVERQPQTSVFIDDLVNSFSECHLSTFF